MAWRKRLLAAALAILAMATGFAVQRPPDALDGVKTAIRLKNFSEAAVMLRRLADGGNDEAQYMLAVFYLNGVNGPRDPAAAHTWLEKSALQGNARAAFSLATLAADAD